MRTRIPVLVVGAGPTGLLTAIELRRRDVDVEVIEVQRDLAGRSYALALHAATLDVLRESGLGEERLPGLAVERLRIEGSASEVVSIPLQSAEGAPRALRVVPQAALERVLRERLDELGTPVHWCHRLASLGPDATGALATVERIETTPSGFTPGVAVSLVADTIEVRADVVIGADGHASAVRRELGIEVTPYAPAGAYAAFDVEGVHDEESVTRIALTPDRAATRWPLGRDRWRWTLEVDPSRNLSEPRFKSRHDWEPAGVLPRDPARTLDDLLERRYPWLRPQEPDRVVWSAVVSFDRTVADAWGAGRCWLVGDAAHLGDPLGFQSMNVGLQEASALAQATAAALAGGGDAPLESYGAASRETWMRTIARPAPSGSTPGWLVPLASRFPGCLPASGGDLEPLLSRLGMGS